VWGLGTVHLPLPPSGMFPLDPGGELPAGHSGLGDGSSAPPFIALPVFRIIFANDFVNRQEKSFDIHFKMSGRTVFLKSLQCKDMKHE